MLIKNIHSGGLDYKAIKEKCPKVASKLEEFMGVSLKAFQDSMLEDFEASGIERGEGEFDIPDITKEIVEESIQNMLSSGALRSLYEFFDSNGVYVFILPPKDLNDWSWGITLEDKSGISDENTYRNRTRAEVFGFSKAFEELENKL